MVKDEGDETKMEGLEGKSWRGEETNKQTGKWWEETYRKWRVECGEWSVESGKWRVEWRVENEEWSGVTGPKLR